MSTNTANDILLVDKYMALLSTLSNRNKILLATRLLDSATRKNGKRHRLDIRTCFNGDWAEGKSATDYANELRNSRTFTRTVEPW